MQEFASILQYVVYYKFMSDSTNEHTIGKPMIVDSENTTSSLYKINMIIIIWVWLYN